MENIGKMDVNRILDELRLERDQLDEAILSLERLALGTRRRGRPPLWIQEAQQRAAADMPDDEVPETPRRRRGRPKKVKADE